MNGPTDGKPCQQYLSPGSHVARMFSIVARSTTDEGYFFAVSGRPEEEKFKLFNVSTQFAGVCY